MKCEKCGGEFSQKVYQIHKERCKVETEKVDKPVVKNKGGRPRK